MQRGLVLLLGALVVLGPVTLVQAGSTAPSGYVAYSVQVTSKGTQQSISINESVTPSSNPSQSILVLAVRAASTNLSYSHVINSTSTVFPYIPGISNTTVNYGNGSASVSARIAQQGTSQVNFQGKAYTLSDYTFSANFTSKMGSGAARGNLSAFPSGLVYSFSSQFNTTRVAVTLVSTSLSLEASAAAPSIQMASAGVGVSVAVAAVALSLGVRVRRNHRSRTAQKPDHWVD